MHVDGKVGSGAPAEVLGYIDSVRDLEGAATVGLELLRRALVQRETPTKETIARAAAFAFDEDTEVALARLDAVAQRVGVSSLR